MTIDEPIFSHTDVDGDSVEICRVDRQMNGVPLMLSAARDGHAARVYLPADLTPLIEALTAVRDEEAGILSEVRYSYVDDDGDKVALGHIDNQSFITVKTAGSRELDVVHLPVSRQDMKDIIDLIKGRIEKE